MHTPAEVQVVTVEQAEANVRRLSDELAEAKSVLRTLRGEAASAKSAPRDCGCGCGGLTSGGTFLPGHDARLRSRLLRTIRGTDGATEEEQQAAYAQLASYPRLSHGLTTWDLGRDARATKEKEERQAEEAKRKEAKIARDKAERDAREAAMRTQSRSRDETNRLAQAEVDRLVAQREAQKEVGTITVPSTPASK
jgi:hypothetical protein